MEDLDPRRHIIADRSREKLSLHLSQFIVLLYGLLCLSVIREAILLYITVAVAPMPPAVVKTRGEKEPCSTSLIVGSPLLEFIPMVTLGERGVAIAWCEWVARKMHIADHVPKNSQPQCLGGLHLPYLLICV